MKVLAVPLSAFIFVLIICVSATTAQIGTPELRKALDENNESLVTLRADVTMIRSGSVPNSDPSVTSGSLLLQRAKGKNVSFRIDWKSPADSLSIIDNKFIYYRRNEKQVITGNGLKTGLYQLLADWSSNILKLNWYVENLGEEKIDENRRTWHLRFTPKINGAYKFFDAWFDSEGMPNRVQVTDNNAKTTLIRLANIRKNDPVRNSEFKISIPRGTKRLK